MLQGRVDEVGMLSKSIPVAITALSLILFSSCASKLPWSHEEPGNEVNLALTIENNLLFLSTTLVNHHRGRMFFGSAEPRSVIDPLFAEDLGASVYQLQLNDRETLPFSPVVLDLKGVGDVMIGADVFGGRTVTIDYRSGLLTLQKDGIHSAYMTLFQFDAAPAIFGEIDGRNTRLIVDTALPDSIVLPRGSAAPRRRIAHVVIAGLDFGDIDIALGDVSSPRVGNRVLSKFLLSIDYGHGQIGLWRDPRIPM